MADAFTLATTLPPDLFSANQSVRLTPVVSATYEPADFARTINNQTHLMKLEAINRAVMSGRRDLADNVIEEVKSGIEAYHTQNIAKMPPTQTIPVLGMSSSLKMATMKHSQNSIQ